ncbi:hypothetical protein [Dethiothermospora halolimnae]|uniref:hypothetical protein n=1 Tax=Dethiothermospora halolimnae TaxID=3114390 RepID=UPI003CCC1037
MESLAKNILKEDINEFHLSDRFINDMKLRYEKLWWQVEGTCLPFSRIYDNREKKKNKKAIKKAINKLSMEINRINQQEMDKELVTNNIKEIIKNFFQDILDYDEKKIDIIFNRGYMETTNEFIKRTKEFEPDIKIEDIFQAIRNVWIANSIQIFLGEDVRLSDSIFGYSMLYPYSDNYLDDPDLSIEEKTKFNKKFSKMLRGKEIGINNKHEKDVLKLVRLMEKQYDRLIYRDVYTSIYAIHGAQKKSVLQQYGQVSPYERNIIDITFEKGGTSVLADGYLVSGRLSKEVAEFMFGYGVILQLADDLQDVNEDFKNSHCTIFSQVAKKWPLDKLTNKLINYINKVLDSAEFITTNNGKVIKEIIRENCYNLIFMAIYKNKGLYTREYIKSIERYSMLYFRDYKKIEKSFKKLYKSFDNESLYIIKD